MAVDGELKASLLTMLEWHARASHKPGEDTWYGGRYLMEWADRRALQELPGTFAAFDQDDLWRALLATLELFQWLAEETAKKSGHHYPQTAYKVTQWIKDGFVEAVSGQSERHNDP